MPTSYATIPTVGQFQSDSSVRMAIRSRDPAVVAIDQNLAEYQSAEPDEKFTLLASLFLAVNAWIKQFHEGKAREKDRYPAVAALSDVVIKTLQDDLGVSNAGQVSKELTKIFGSVVNDHGKYADTMFQAQFFSKQALDAKRIHWDGGKAYRYMIDVPNGAKGLALLDSQAFANPGVARKLPDGTWDKGLSGFAPFVMSLEQEFYMSRHMVSKGGVFHSAYFGPNRSVAAAGTMLVVRGEVLGIRGDSGHFKPTPAQIAMALRALRNKGVNLKKVAVYDFDKLTSAATGDKHISKASFAKPPPPMGGGSACGSSYAGNSGVGSSYIKTPVTTPMTTTPTYYNNNPTYSTPVYSSLAGMIRQQSAPSNYNTAIFVDGDDYIKYN